MQKSINLIFICLLICFSLGIGKAQVLEGFEDPNCTPLTNPFFDGCFPEWTCASGTPDVNSNTIGVTAAEGTKYVRMVSQWRGGTCPNFPQRSEGIILNQTFKANRNYKIIYAIRWGVASETCAFSKSEWILTNGRENQRPSSSCLNDGGVTPDIDPGDMIVQTHFTGVNATDWSKFTVEFTPTANFTQLWLRNELIHEECPLNSDPRRDNYLDNFKLFDCTDNNYSSGFSLFAGADQQGNVSVYNVANSNPIEVTHGWDIYDAEPNGSVNGNTQIPGIPYQTDKIAFFNKNMVIGRWYYVKHGIFNACISWRETRKAFRVLSFAGFSGETLYKVEMKDDTGFEPNKDYLMAMTEMAETNNLQAMFREDVLLKSPEINAPTSLRNFPNPFSQQTTLEFTIKEEAPVSLFVSDLMGKQIAVLLNGEVTSSGTHQVIFESSAYPAGVYFYAIRAGVYTETKKMTLVK